MKTSIINLYYFSELTEAAKLNAIQAHRDFELSAMQPCDFISGDAEFDTEEELNKAYRLQFDYYENNDEPIIESIEMNEYLFFSNGELANCTTFTGKHEKAGLTELRIGTDIYIVD